MPIYPALQVKSLDFPAILQNAQNLRSGATRNRLQEAQLGQFQQQQQARQQYAPGALAGDQGAMQAYAAIDPDGAAKLQDIVGRADERQRAELQAQNLEMGQMAHYIASAQNEPMRQSRWTEVRGSSPEIAEVMPETFDQNFLDMQVARIMTTKELLAQEQGQQPLSPAGKRAYDRDQGFLTQGEYDQATVAGGGSNTALMQNTRFLQEQLGISPREAIDLLQRSKTESREEMIFTLAGRLMTTQFLDRDEAKQQAANLYDTIFAGPSVPADTETPQPTSPGIIERAGDAIGGFMNPQGEAAPGGGVLRGMGMGGPGRTPSPAPGPGLPEPIPTTSRGVAPALPPSPGGMGLAGPGLAPRPAVPPVPPVPLAAGPQLPPIETMTLTEVSDIVNRFGDSLSPEQLKAIDERLKALGR